MDSCEWEDGWETSPKEYPEERRKVQSRAWCIREILIFRDKLSHRIGSFAANLDPAGIIIAVQNMYR